MVDRIIEVDILHPLKSIIMYFTLDDRLEMDLTLYRLKIILI